MARKDALLRLHQRLLKKRDALRKKLSENLNLGSSASAGGGDVGDAAADGERTELDSQLAALESRELRQIERAIEMIREGTYGICEICESRIPIARLQALPYTPVCVNCQRKFEEFNASGEAFDADWESAYEFEGRFEDREVTLGDLEPEI